MYTLILSGVIVSTGPAVLIGVGAGVVPGRGVSSRIDFHNASAAEVHRTRLWSGGWSSTGTVANQTWEVDRPTTLWATSHSAFRLARPGSAVSDLVTATGKRKSLSGRRSSWLLVASWTPADMIA